MDPEPPGMFQLETWESLWFAIPVGMDDADELAEIIQVLLLLALLYVMRTRTVTTWLTTSI
jgi:hypothetical protein